MALISIAAGQVIEGPADSVRRLYFTVSLSAPTTTDVTVDYATSDSTAKNLATAGTDYTVASGTLTIEAGHMTGYIMVDVLGDALREGNEVFNLTLSNPLGAGFAKGTTLVATGTIVDDEPIITVGNGKLTEGVAGSVANMLFTVTLSAPAPTDVVIPYVTADATGKSLATADVDYEAVTGGSLTLPAGSTGGVIAIPVIGDAVKEAAELFTLTLSDPVGAGFSKGTTLSVTGTINDDTPVITVNSPKLAEGVAKDDRKLYFVVSLSAPAAQTVTVDYATAGSTAKNPATAGTDYTATTGTVTIPVGESVAYVPVPVIGDAVKEGDEVFNLVFSNPHGAGFSKGDSLTAVGTIQDGAPTITVAPATAMEGSGEDVRHLYFAVNLSKPTLQEVRVTYATTDNATAKNPALEDTDYTATSGVVIIPAGQVSGLIRVDILPDEVQEGNEVFDLVLSEPVGAGFAKGDTLTVAGTLQDDESTSVPPLPKFSIAPAKTFEPVAGQTAVMRFPVLLSAPSETAVTVRYQTNDLPIASPAKGGVDYVATSGKLIFQPGETAGYIDVTVLGDRHVEADEGFGLTLFNPRGAGLQSGTTVTVTGTIVDDRPAITAGDAKVPEGNAPGGVREISYLRFPVMLSGPSTEFVSVHYKTADLTARSTSDYIAATGVVVFAPGDTLKYVNVPVLGGNHFEPDETISLKLYQASGASLATATGITVTGTIINDEPTVSAASATVGEGGPMDERILHFPVTLSHPTSVPVVLHYQTIPSTALNAATPGKDYVISSGDLVIPAGATVGYVDVKVIGDGVKEADELVALKLTSTKGAVFGDGNQLIVNGTIIDDEPLLSAKAASVVEGDDNQETVIHFPVSLSFASDDFVSVHFKTIPQTGSTAARPVSDYQTSSGIAIFAPGEQFKTIDITIYGDTRKEADETFILQFDHPVGAGLEGGGPVIQVIGTIIDNEPIIITP